MKAFTALASFAALALAFFRTEVLASPIPSQDSIEDSVKISAREPILPGPIEEENLLIRDTEASAYGWDHPKWHKYGGYYRDLEDSESDDPDNDNELPRDENSVDAPDSMEAVDAFEDSGLGSETAVKREGDYYGRHHRNRHYRRDDAELESDRQAQGIVGPLSYLPWSPAPGSGGGFIPHVPPPGTY